MSIVRTKNIAAIPYEAAIAPVCVTAPLLISGSTSGSRLVASSHRLACGCGRGDDTQGNGGSPLVFPSALESMASPELDVWRQPLRELEARAFSLSRAFIMAMASTACARTLGNESIHSLSLYIRSGWGRSLPLIRTRGLGVLELALSSEPVYYYERGTRARRVNPSSKAGSPADTILAWSRGCAGIEEGGIRVRMR